MMGPSVWGLSEIVQSEKGPTVIGPSVIGQSEILAQTDGPQRPWAQIVLGQNEIQASRHPRRKIYTFFPLKLVNMYRYFLKLSLFFLKKLKASFINLLSCFKL